MEILLAVGAMAVLFSVLFNIEIFEAGLVGLWDAFVGVWRTLARLVKEGR